MVVQLLFPCASQDSSGFFLIQFSWYAGHDFSYALHAFHLKHNRDFFFFKCSYTW